MKDWMKCRWAHQPSRTTGPHKMKPMMIHISLWHSESIGHILRRCRCCCRFRNGRNGSKHNDHDTVFLTLGPLSSTNEDQKQAREGIWNNKWFYISRLIIFFINNNDIIHQSTTTTSSFSNYLTGHLVRHSRLSKQEDKNKMLFGSALMPFVMLKRPFTFF